MECYKSCDFNEYLDDKNCKCKKRIADKLAEECIENIEEATPVEIISSKNESMHKCSPRTLYIVLISIFFTLNVEIAIYFLFLLVLEKKTLLVLSLVPALKQQFNELRNGKIQINRDQKSNLLFLKRRDQF